jgi:hypothetical protein
VAYYEIRVAGMLPSEVLLDFERLSADPAPVETVLHGPLPDQAALAAFLARLQDFGADVIEIRRLREDLRRLPRPAYYLCRRSRMSSIPADSNFASRACRAA